jgi:hypothetical protein
MFYEVMDANVFALPVQFYKTPAKFVSPILKHPGSNFGRFMDNCHRLVLLHCRMTQMSFEISRAVQLAATSPPYYPQG